MRRPEHRRAWGFLAANALVALWSGALAAETTVNAAVAEDTRKASLLALTKTFEFIDSLRGGKPR